MDSNKFPKLVILLAIIFYAVTWNFPPSPDVDPDIDPKPDPIVIDPPMPVEKLHVLIIEETANRGSLLPEQALILQSVALRRYVQQVGGEFRQIDDDVVPDKMDKVWQDAWKLERGDSPWWIVSNGKGGVNEKLPANLDVAMQTLQKWSN